MAEPLMGTVVFDSILSPKEETSADYVSYLFRHQTLHAMPAGAPSVILPQTIFNETKIRFSSTSMLA